MTKGVAAVAVIVAAVALVAGCGLSGDPQRMIAKAQEYRQKHDYKAAIIELKNALQKDANHAEARYWLGVAYLDNREYRSAEQELRRALDLSYERSKVLPMLGKALLLLGEHQKVLDQVPLEAHTANDVQAGVLTLRARALMGLGRNDNARELLGGALSKQPEFADALVELSRLAAGDRKPDEAAGLVERAIKSAPQHADAWLLKGDLAYARADQAGALAAYQKVIEFHPKNLTAPLNISLIHIENNKLADAKKMIAEARKIAPGNTMAYQMQALADYRARDYRAANDAIQQVLKVAPNYTPGLLLAGAILTELGSHEQAQAHLGRVIDAAPNNLFARKVMVSSLARSGQIKRALDNVQPLLKQVPDDPALMMLAGGLYLQSGQFNLASEYFERASKLDPKSASARMRLGMTRFASGDAGKGYADIETAVGLDSAGSHADMVLIAMQMRQGKLDEALKTAQALEKKQPKNPIVSNLMAGIYLGKKDIPNARKSFERTLELLPTSVFAATNLAQLDIQDKNPKSARGRFEAVLAKDKTNEQALLALAEFGGALGASPQERAAWLERARQAHPKSLRPLQMLIQLHLKSGDTKKALDVAQQAQSGSPDNPMLLELLGATQLSAGQNEPAIATYRKLAQAYPKSPLVLYRLALAQEANADLAGAEESLKKSVALNPGYEEALSALVSLKIRAKQFPEATNIARQVQKQNPKAPVGYGLEGFVLMAEKKPAQAIKVYETVHGMEKSSASLINLHMAYTAAGKAEEGDAQLAQWLSTYPMDDVVRLYAGDAALKSGKFKEAIAYYEPLREGQAENSLMLNNLAWAYAQVKDARALETAERAYKLTPDNPIVADTYGSILLEQGNTARANEVLEKAAKAAPNAPEIHYHLAQGWMKAGDKAKARAAVERALAIKKPFPDQAEATALLKQLGK